VFYWEKEQELYLGMLTVSPELQNSGLGKKLLQQAEVHAQALGLPKIVMTVISPGRTNCLVQTSRLYR
jgi:ribosomal protein S18 acetylase RimI-like enzyme